MLTRPEISRYILKAFPGCSTELNLDRLVWQLGNEGKIAVETRNLVDENGKRIGGKQCFYDLREVVEYLKEDAFLVVENPNHVGFDYIAKKLDRCYHVTRNLYRDDPLFPRTIQKHPGYARSKNYRFDKAEADAYIEKRMFTQRKSRSPAKSKLYERVHEPNELIALSNQFMRQLGARK